MTWVYNLCGRNVLVSQKLLYTPQIRSMVQVGQTLATLIHNYFFTICYNLCNVYIWLKNEFIIQPLVNTTKSDNELLLREKKGRYVAHIKTLRKIMATQ
ncbi:MAG: hypothetical protein UU98_C0028G0012 [Parcubacteria group bacterium GW2011_GWD2_42_14]|nr:MAG: hypothetical protein UU98_C0028G0012 [Parcubacteria group bacterium GW2011_GWD2_42_14]